MADPETGWDFRPYSPVLWRKLRATYQEAPFMLSSATLNSESLEWIKVSLGIEGEEVKVLSSNCDSNCDGNQAAFVILLWVGQAGQYSYLMHQQICMNCD